MKTTRFEKAQEGEGEKRNEADDRRHRRDGAVCTQLIPKNVEARRDPADHSVPHWLMEERVRQSSRSRSPCS